MSSSDSEGLVIDEKLSMSSCTNKFAGVFDKEATEEIIAKIENFKRKNSITNEEAFMEIDYLFTDSAKDWWGSVKNAVKNWTDAITLVRYVYAPSKPSHIVYGEIFQMKQHGDTTIEFVNKLRKLFLQLPKPHSEQTQLNMIYYKLNDTMKMNVPRDSINSYDELIQKSRELEGETSMPKKQKKKRVRCTSCRIYGHTSVDCKKLRRTEDYLKSNKGNIMKR